MKTIRNYTELLLTSILCLSSGLLADTTNRSTKAMPLSKNSGPSVSGSPKRTVARARDKDLISVAVKNGISIFPAIYITVKGLDTPDKGLHTIGGFLRKGGKWRRGVMINLQKSAENTLYAYRSKDSVTHPQEGDKRYKYVVTPQSNARNHHIEVQNKKLVYTYEVRATTKTSNAKNAFLKDTKELPAVEETFMNGTWQESTDPKK